MHASPCGSIIVIIYLTRKFYQKNEALYYPDGAIRIADTALVAMTLLIAESKPDEKEILTLVLVNLIGRKEL
jgi:hypothetical protein